jgi:hypothetical protein
MIGADFHPFVLFGYSPTDMQLSSLRVEIDGRDTDEEGYVDASGGCTTSGGFGRNSTDGRCAE